MGLLLPGMKLLGLWRLVALVEQSQISSVAARHRSSGRVADWLPEDVAAWLKDVGLETHVESFLRERIDGAALLELTAEELRAELGMAFLGERKMLLREVGVLRRKPTEDQSSSEPSALPCNSTGAVCPHDSTCNSCCGSDGQNCLQYLPSRPDGVGQHGWGFDFGGNWLRFLSGLLEEESPLGVDEAQSYFAGTQVRRVHARVLRFATMLLEEFGVASLAGLTFLDVGCGHGLASLAAVHLNASRVVSMDIDTRPVRELRRMIHEQKTLSLDLKPGQTWDIRKGSILDMDFVNSGVLPKADLVWSYGVLHHTGNLRLALQNTARLVCPAGLVKIDIHTSEESLLMEDWLDFKREWQTRPNWYKEEALISYMFSELWAEMQERVMMDRLDSQFPGLAASPGFFGRFESVRHVVHSRFWRYTRGRGMDFVIDAVDWLGGYPYELMRMDEVLDVFRAAEPPLKALHATFDGFAGLLLTPAPPGIGWSRAAAAVQSRLRDNILHVPSALWSKKRKLLTVPPGSIANFSALVAENCEHFGESNHHATPTSICSAPFLSMVKGHACWVTFFSAEGIEGDDTSLFHFLEDGDILGWGAPNLTLCVLDRGASFRFFRTGVVLFTVRGGSDPRTNGRRYQILAPE